MTTATTTLDDPPMPALDAEGHLVDSNDWSEGSPSPSCAAQELRSATTIGTWFDTLKELS
jgi:hypothetical protein